MLDAASGHRDRVESHARFIGARAADVIARGTAQRNDLLAVDIALGCGPFPARARLDLDEHEPVAFPRDDVDLTAALRRTPVARHHPEAFGAQVPMSKVLAVAAGVAVFA